MAQSSAKKWRMIVAFLIVVMGGVAVWFRQHRPQIPAGFASGNGRLEATQVDIATKFPGRLAEVLAREGDQVEADQVVARIDATSLRAQLREAEARVRQAQRDRSLALATVTRRESEYDLALKTLQRTRDLYERDNASLQDLQHDQAGEQTAKAAIAEANAQVAATAAAIEAAIAETQRLKADIDDCVLKAPLSGRVLYRLAEAGEVLAEGGKVLTILDLTDVYMTIFLPTQEAGRIAIGADARILLDAAPDIAVPATVSFVAAKAQFTPKEIETRTEREKLMFRVKLRIAPALLKQHEPLVKTGLPGIAYVRLDANADWPAPVQTRRTP
jgi:HlyD family secretion protein